MFALSPQEVLLNLGAHKVASSLIEWYTQERFVAALGRPESGPLMETIQASYRLLVALCSFGFKQAQLEISKGLSSIMAQASTIGSYLRAGDVSPTHCLIALHRDNYHVCEQVCALTISTVCEMMRNDPTVPRYPFFLRMIVMPEGKAIPQNQVHVIQAVSALEDELLLFKGRAGISEREQLLADARVDFQYLTGGIMPTTPSGLKLRLHMELINLLGECAVGYNAPAEILVRDLLTLEEVMAQMFETNLPLELRGAYLNIFTEAYLITDIRTSKSLAALEEIPALLQMLNAEIRNDEHLETADGQHFVLTRVLPCIEAFLDNIVDAEWQSQRLKFSEELWVLGSGAIELATRLVTLDVVSPQSLDCMMQAPGPLPHAFPPQRISPPHPIPSHPIPPKYRFLTASPRHFAATHSLTPSPTEPAPPPSIMPLHRAYPTTSHPFPTPPFSAYPFHPSLQCIEAFMRTGILTMQKVAGVQSELQKRMTLILAQLDASHNSMANDPAVGFKDFLRAFRKAFAEGEDNDHFGGEFKMLVDIFAEGLSAEHEEDEISLPSLVFNQFRMGRERLGSFPTPEASLTSVGRAADESLSRTKDVVAAVTNSAQITLSGARLPGLAPFPRLPGLAPFPREPVNEGIPIPDFNHAKTLIIQLIAGASHSRSEGPPPDVPRTVSSVNILVAVINYVKGDPASLKVRQLRMVEIDAVRLALMLSFSRDSHLSSVGLEYISALLYNGHREVQDEAYSLLTSGNLVAYDGSSSSLPHEFQRRLRLAMTELPELRDFEERKKERLRELKTGKRNLSPSEQARLVLEEEAQVFPSEANVLKVLKMMQLSWWAAVNRTLIGWVRLDPSAHVLAVYVAVRGTITSSKNIGGIKRGPWGLSISCPKCSISLQPSRACLTRAMCATSTPSL